MELGNSSESAGTGSGIDIISRCKYNSRNILLFYLLEVVMDDSGASTIKFNFGNGYFGTTSFSYWSEADAAGEGQFEYDPSTGSF